MLPLKDTVPARAASVATWLLIAANVVVYLFELSLPEPVLQQFLYIFGIVPARYTGAMSPSFGAAYWYWPFLTSMFLHAGWLHLIGNMWGLWIFGKSVEQRMGSLRFLLFYILCGLAAGAAQVLLQPTSTVPGVGASGAIAGVMGAYLVMFPTATILTLVPIFIFPLFLELPAVLFIGVWFLIQFLGAASSSLSTSQVGGVAWWAHIGGFAFGMLTYRLFQPRRRRFELDELGITAGWRSPRWS